jgi:hypothetical protein
MSGPKLEDAFERVIEDLDPVSDDIEFHRLETDVVGEASLLRIDQAEHQIAPVTNIKRGACARLPRRAMRQRKSFLN